MKTKILVLLLGVCALQLTGCKSLPDPQLVLNKILPPDFVGNVHVEHSNPYFDFGVDAGNVHKDAAGLWTWDSFKYSRADMFHTKGDIELTPLAAPVPAK